VKEQSPQALNIIEGDTIEYLLSDRQMTLWQWVHKQAPDEFSRGEAISALGLPARTVESILKKLLELNKIRRFGQGRATRYTLRK